MKSAYLTIRSLLIIILFLKSLPGTGQEAQVPPYLGKAGLYKAKETALDYLGNSQIVKKFGIISDSIWRYAELGMQEFRSSSLLEKNLEDEGFRIEKGVAGMPTCFVATWGSGKPVIGILGEFDALPMLSQKALSPVQDPMVTGAPGHGCGHNTMGTAGIAAAIAVKRSMEKNHIGGTLKFFGTPAEETLIGKPYMVKEGVFKDVDAIIDNHAGSSLSTSYGVSGNAMISVFFTFRGKTAHAGSAPWEGRSALDAVELMNVSTNYLREHLFYTYRMHYVITEGGEAPNVVPDRATVWYFLRNTDDRLEDMYNRVVDCARGAAIASGTKIDTILFLAASHQKHSNRLLAETMRRNIELIGLPEWTEKENQFAKALQKQMGSGETGYPVKIGEWQAPPVSQVGGASTDVGEVSLIAPTATLIFPSVAPGSQGHHWSTVASDYGTAAWKGLNAGAKVMAATAIDLLTNSQLLADIKKEFSDYIKEHPYKSFLPEGAKPSLDFNKELMAKYRKAMMQVNAPEE